MESRASQTALRIFPESANFHQLEAPPGLPLPLLVLMLVDDGVFQTLELTKSDLKPIATPGVIAVIVLKLHAIRQPARDDREKDCSNILCLIKVLHHSLDDPELSATAARLCCTWGGPIQRGVGVGDGTGGSALVEINQRRVKKGASSAFQQSHLWGSTSVTYFGHESEMDFRIEGILAVNQMIEQGHTRLFRFSDASAAVTNVTMCAITSRWRDLSRTPGERDIRPPQSDSEAAPK